MPHTVCLPQLLAQALSSNIEVSTITKILKEEYVCSLF